MSRIDDLTAAVADAQAGLGHHPVFSSIQTIDQLRRFMEWHVFAVWDFMSLVKRLQRDLTCQSIPWVPPEYPKAARLINDIVLGEESDEAPGGVHLSHFALYLSAMAEVGASTKQIELFVGLIRCGVPVSEALHQVQAPLPIVEFVAQTLATAQNGTLPQVLGFFLYGRESIIPDMFRALLAQWNMSQDQAPTFVFYLDRHIELDNDRHAPAARLIVEEIVGREPNLGIEMLTAACQAIKLRNRLWDGLLDIG